MEQAAPMILTLRHHPLKTNQDPRSSPESIHNRSQTGRGIQINERLLNVRHFILSAIGSAAVSRACGETAFFFSFHVYRIDEALGINYSYYVEVLCTSTTS